MTCVCKSLPIYFNLFWYPSARASCFTQHTCNSNPCTLRSRVMTEESPLQAVCTCLLWYCCHGIFFCSIRSNVRCSAHITDTQLSSMLQLKYFTRPLDVLHLSWTMLMLGKKTIAVCPFAATLIPEFPPNKGGFVSCNSWCCFCFRHPHALSRMKVTSLKTYPYTPKCLNRASIGWGTLGPSNSHSWPTNWLTLSCLWFLLLSMAQGGWNSDIETRCMQEVVDAEEVRTLQQQKRKKWWRGQWGKSTYEAKWMQEIERHLGGRESSILKQDERKKLLRDIPHLPFVPPSQIDPSCLSLVWPNHRIWTNDRTKMFHVECCYANSCTFWFVLFGFHRAQRTVAENFVNLWQCVCSDWGTQFPFSRHKSSNYQPDSTNMHCVMNIVFCWQKWTIGSRFMEPNLACNLGDNPA